jgi:hypothetical protein
MVYCGKGCAGNRSIYWNQSLHVLRRFSPNPSGIQDIGGGSTRQPVLLQAPDQSTLCHFGGIRLPAGEVHRHDKWHSATISAKRHTVGHPKTRRTILDPLRWLRGHGNCGMKNETPRKKRHTKLTRCVAVEKSSIVSLITCYIRATYNHTADQPSLSMPTWRTWSNQTISTWLFNSDANTLYADLWQSIFLV